MSFTRLSLFPLLTNTLPGSSASEVMTLWHYTNLLLLSLLLLLLKDVFCLCPSNRGMMFLDVHPSLCAHAERHSLFCSLAVFDPRVGHTMDVLSPFISVFCHSDWLFHGESYPHLDVVHPGHAWSSSAACTWHCSLHYLFLHCFLMVWP